MAVTIWLNHTWFPSTKAAVHKDSFQIIHGFLVTRIHKQELKKEWREGRKEGRKERRKKERKEKGMKKEGRE
jgi:hypothetical protein